MPLTGLKISLNEYKRLIEKDINRAKKDSIYGGLLDNLSKLTDMTQKYYTYNADGKHPTLYAKDYKDLIKVYSALAKSCNDFLDDDRKKDRLEEKRVNIIKNLFSCVQKDLKGLVKTDKEKPLTLSDIVKEARVKTVDLSDKKLGRVGGALSARIPLKSASGVEGFFTKKVVFDYDGSFQDIMDKLDKDLPEVFRKGFQSKKSREYFFDNLVMFRDLDLNSPDKEIKENSYRSLAMAINSLNNSMSEDNIVDMLKKDPQFATSMLEIQQKYSALGVQRDMNNVIGISSNNCRLDQRNSAMSDVASLLGMQGIIAKSIPMNIVHDGKVYEGTFMEKAKGEDIGHLTKDSLALQVDADSFNHPTGLKQLADLQILDYICGNVDRHDANLMYQFKEVNGKVVLDGICGFDNDSSFGTKLFETTKGVKELTPLSGIVNMSMSCYEALKALSTDALRVVLADKLNKEEIDAVCKRIDLLDKKIEAKQINLVADDAWGKGGVTYDKLSAGFRGISATIKNAIKTIDISKEAFESLKEKKSSLNYVSGKDVTDMAETRFEEIYGKLEEFENKTGKLKSKFHKNSEEYMNMMTSLKEALDFGKEIKAKLELNENVDLKKYQEFAKFVVDLGTTSQSYIDAKNISQFTEMGKDRIALATEMRNLAQENFAIKEMPVKKDVEPKELKQPEEEMQL